jgi:hypothetical protein
MAKRQNKNRGYMQLRVWQRKRNSGDWLDSFTEEGERAETEKE